jgi:hypothetical protein
MGTIEIRLSDGTRAYAETPDEMIAHLVNGLTLSVGDATHERMLAALQALVELGKRKAAEFALSAARAQSVLQAEALVAGVLAQGEAATTFNSEPGASGGGGE